MARTVSRHDNAFYGFERTVLFPLLDQIARTKITTIERFGTTWPVPQEQQFRTLIEAQVCADVLVSSRSFRDLFPEWNTRILVAASDTIDAYVSSRGTTIYLPEHTNVTDSEFMREGIIWHEVAHIVSRSMSHAKKFQESYFKVIEAAYGAMFAQFVRILHVDAR